MIKIYNDNGLPFWTQEDIANRFYLVDVLTRAVTQTLLKENRGWVFERIEAPVLTPPGFVNEEYNVEDYFQIIEHVDYSSTEQPTRFALRPETTASSYEYAKYLIEHQAANPPLCVYQLGKSFRNENDQVSKNMRFKEFYQLEFQCIYTEQTLNDYHKAVLEPLRQIVENVTRRQARLVDSDRTPSYSYKTVDIEVDVGYKWLEVCSISLRDDVPFEWNHKALSNVEIAFGADRLVEILGGLNEE